MLKLQLLKVAFARIAQSANMELGGIQQSNTLRRLFDVHATWILEVQSAGGGVDEDSHVSDT